MNGIIGKNKPLWITVLLLWAVLVILVLITFRQNQGHLIYALDDPYIHMAMAKNFAQHGVWGITPYEFSSSSSSPLWTLALAALFFIFGANDWIPLLLATLVATGALVIIFRLLHRWDLTLSQRLLLLLSVAFLTPFPVLIFTGMEHILHALVTILFVYYASLSLTSPAGRPAKTADKFLLIMGPLLPVIRYEALFLIFVVCLLFLLRRRWGFALALGLLAWLPLAIYGWIAVQHGWFWLPNSVLLKGSSPDFSSLRGFVLFLLNGFGQFWGARRLLALFLVALLLVIMAWKKQKRLWDFTTIMLVIFLATTILHILFAKTGWFFRYEAYLIAVGIFICLITFYDYWSPSVSPANGMSRKKSRIAPAGAWLLLGALSYSSLRAIAQIPTATGNIYDQHYQMATFLQQYYQGSSLAADDVGVINYLTDLHCLDLVGLGSKEVARAKVNQQFNRDKIAALAQAQGAEIAITHDLNYQRLYGGLPESWGLVGQWTISNNIVCGGATLSFYAINPEQAQTLREKLRAFSAQLPADIVQEGDYLLNDPK